MNNEQKLIHHLLAGVKDPRSDVKAAALIAIGESGMIDEDLFIAALEDGVKDPRADVKAAAHAGMGRMLRGANRQ
ncbi:hypothetical protein SL040_003989 [Aeromonas salmonicida]|nr:hypothetical protein [Aeromonas salmonicida]ELY2003741.1 hypothetical protein [Aeromonas salmonicida]MCR4454198.1 hypothetical protein [Aeromonas salmonicida]